MGDGAQKLQRAAKSHVSSRAFGILLVLVSAWKSDHGCLLLEEGFGFSLGCMRAKLPLCWQTQQPGLLLQLFLTIHGAQSSSFGKGWLDWELKREEAVGARSTLACGLSSLWSLFPNCPSLQKDAVRWWGELYHPEPPSCGRAHCATGHPHTKDQCPPSTNPHLPSQSFPLPQFSLQQLLRIGNKVPSMSPSHASLFSRLRLWKWKMGTQT